MATGSSTSGQLVELQGYSGLLRRIVPRPTSSAAVWRAQRFLAARDESVHLIAVRAEGPR